jgi:hypothetical protein
MMTRSGPGEPCGKISEAKRKGQQGFPPTTRVNVTVGHNRELDVGAGDTEAEALVVAVGVRVRGAAGGAAVADVVAGGD